MTAPERNRLTGSRSAMELQGWLHWIAAGNIALLKLLTPWLTCAVADAATLPLLRPSTFPKK